MVQSPAVGPSVDDYGSTVYTLHSLSKILLYLYGAIVLGASAGVPFICALIRVGVLILEFCLIWIFFSQLSNMTLPTIPVAPTTATLISFRFYF